MSELKIIKMVSENIKNLKVVEISPKGNVIIVSGKNGAGKSAVIDALWLAIDIKNAAKSYPDPIRHGEDHASVTIDMGDFIVTRTWTKTKTYLKIENKDGAIFKSPQAMLDKFKGKLSFDPAEFAQLSEKEQMETLLKLLNIPIDLSELDIQSKELYDERTIVNRETKSLEAQYKAIEVDTNVPDDEVSTTDIMDAYTAASDQLVSNNKIRVDLKAKIDEANELEKSLHVAKQKVKDIELKRSSNDVTLEDLRIQEEELKNPDLESFKCKLDDVETLNKMVRLKIEKNKIYQALRQMTDKAKSLTNNILELARVKATHIHEADMPLDHLGFDENGVTYRNKPLKQCSSGEQLRVSVAIAMALNPDLRVIRIADGSLLDSTNMKIIEEMAQDKDFQVWIEVVDESGKLGVYIEEGEVITDNYTK